MRSRRGLIQIVRSNNLVLYTFVVQFQGLVSIVTLEDQKVLDLKLIWLRPSYFQSLVGLIVCERPLKMASIEQVIDLLVVDLQEWHCNCDWLVLHLLSLSETLSDRSDCNTIVFIFRDDRLASSLIHFCFVILVTFHGVCFAWASLPISKNGSMEAFNNLLDEGTDLELIKDIFLAILVVYDFVEPECFPQLLVLIVRGILGYPNLVRIKALT